MKTIAFLLHNNFEQAEYEEVNNKLKAKGYITLLITTNKEKEVQGKQQDVNKGDTFTADIFAKDAKPAEYDALVLPVDREKRVRITHRAEMVGLTKTKNTYHTK